MAHNPLRPLTAKEKKVLEFIENYLCHEGIAPSYLEIKEHFGFASFNSVQRYLKQLQTKKYIYIPGGNQKRAITVLQTSQVIASSVEDLRQGFSSPTPSSPNPPPRKKETSTSSTHFSSGSLSLPLYGRVAAGRPIEAIDHDEFIDIPPSMVRNPEKSYALKVEGDSMIEDSILDGDIILVQEKSHANNGEIIVAVVDNEATVKRFYLHKDRSKLINKNTQGYTHFNSDQPIVELRPSNSTMESLWYPPGDVKIAGSVVGLLRQF